MNKFKVGNKVKIMRFVAPIDFINPFKIGMTVTITKVLSLGSDYKSKNGYMVNDSEIIYFYEEELIHAVEIL